MIIQPAKIRPWKPRVQSSEHSTVDFYDDLELCQYIRTLNEMWKTRGTLLREQSFFCRLLVFTGARIHEGVYILMEHCQDNKIHLEKVKANSRGEMHERDVEWFPEFQPFYDDFMAERRHTKDMWLFPAKRHRLTVNRMMNMPISLELAHKWWREAVELSGVRRLTSHRGARKTFATWGSEFMDRQDLQDQLGHADYKTTDTIYRGSISGRRFKKPFPEWRKVALEPYPKEYAELMESLAKVKQLER